MCYGIFCPLVQSRSHSEVYSNKHGFLTTPATAPTAAFTSTRVETDLYARVLTQARLTANAQTDGQTSGSTFMFTLSLCINIYIVTHMHTIIHHRAEHDFETGEIALSGDSIRFHSWSDVAASSHTAASSCFSIPDL